MKVFTYNFLKSKNGIKIREKYLQKNFPDEYKQVKDFINKYTLNKISFQESLFLFLHNQTEPNKCKTCNSEPVHFESFNCGYLDFCSQKCSANNDDIRLKKQQTLKEKYGSETTFTSPQIKEKINKTIIEKYGVSNVFQSAEIKEKSKTTLLKKYGVKNISQTPENRKKAKDKIQEIKRNYSKVREQFEIKYSDIKFINHIGNNLTYYCGCNEQNICEMERNLFRFRYLNKINICTKCAPISNAISQAENEILEYVKSITGNNVISKDKDTIAPLELDIYVPELNIAIEYNGLYWHREEKVGKKYHITKTKMCEDKNIQLIHIFEDEWLEKKEIVKSILNNNIGKKLKKIYARKCNIINLNKSEAFDFYEKNHILGGYYCDVNYGLELDGELYAVIGFGKQRKIMNKKNLQNKYELIRYCNKLNTSVVGGGSKLFSHFVKTVLPTEIVTYANRRYFNGNFYKHLGFSFVGETRPNYFYLSTKNTQKREHRFKYRKDILVKKGENPEQSESQIMAKNGYYKIYDCGNFKFIWKN